MQKLIIGFETALIITISSQVFFATRVVKYAVLLYWTGGR